MPRPRKVERKKSGPKPKTAFHFRLEGFAQVRNVQELMDKLYNGNLSQVNINSVVIDKHHMQMMESFGKEVAKQ